MTENYNRNRVMEKIREYEVNGRPTLKVGGEGAPYYELIKKAMEDSLPHLIPTFLYGSRCFADYKYHNVVDNDLLDKAGLLTELTKLLYVTDGAISGMNVLDLGCGSTEERDYYFGREWLPYMAEILTRLGATVNGVDYRPNIQATYHHRTADLLNRDTIIEGDFDLIVAKSLGGGVIGVDPNFVTTPDSTIENKVRKVIGGVLRPNQLILTDLIQKEDHVTSFGVKPVFSRELVNTLWYR